VRRVHQLLRMSSAINSRKDEQIALIHQSIKSLNVQREALEYESAAIESELTSSDPANPTVPPMGIDTPLTDAEGFPRNDIDIFSARTLRHRLAIIRTDHKKFMNEIENLLQQIAILQKQQTVDDTVEAELEARQKLKPKPKFDPITGKWVVRNWDGTIAGAGVNNDTTPRSFDELSSEPPMQTEPTSTNPSAYQQEELSHENNPVVHKAAAIELSGKPLARVESVADDSPASLAGLEPNDFILSFGPIVNEFGDSITQLVQQAAGNKESIELRIFRGNFNNANAISHKDTVVVQLFPRPWNGRGLLGCHIVPV
jgi:membrane-associated protease RseP (regulator of RpoE activity)